MSDQEARREEEVGTEEAEEGEEEGLQTEEAQRAKVKARRAKMRLQLTAILDNPIAGYQIEEAGNRGEFLRIIQSIRQPGEDAIDWFFWYGDIMFLSILISVNTFFNRSELMNKSLKFIHKLYKPVSSRIGKQMVCLLV